MSEEQEPKDHQENHQNSDHEEGEDNDVMFVEDEIIDEDGNPIQDESEADIAEQIYNDLTIELEDDEVDLGGNAFSPEQYVLAVGSYSKDIVSPGQKVFLDVESMTVKVNNPDDVYNPVMKISLKPVEVEGKIFGVITEDKIEYLIRG